MRFAVLLCVLATAGCKKDRLTTSPLNSNNGPNQVLVNLQCDLQDVKPPWDSLINFQNKLNLLNLREYVICDCDTVKITTDSLPFGASFAGWLLENSVKSEFITLPFIDTITVDTKLKAIMVDTTIDTPSVSSPIMLKFIDCN